MNMKTYQEWLNEGKQVGFLYHFTDCLGLKSILQEGYIRGYTAGQSFANDRRIEITNKRVISVSRNKKFYFGEFRLTLDGDQISNKYKIIPYQEKSTDKFDKERQMYGESAAEEIIICDKLNLKYLLEIEAILNEGRKSPDYEYFYKTLTQDSINGSIGSDEVDWEIQRDFKTIKYNLEHNIKIGKSMANYNNVAIYLLKYFINGGAVGQNLRKLLMPFKIYKNLIK